MWVCVYVYVCRSSPASLACVTAVDVWVGFRLSVCLFVCISLLDIWVIFIMDFFFFILVFPIQYQKRFEVFGSISEWLMRRSVGVFVSLEKNTF